MCPIIYAVATFFPLSYREHKATILTIQFLFVNRYQGNFHLVEHLLLAERHLIHFRTRRLRGSWMNLGGRPMSNERIWNLNENRPVGRVAILHSCQWMDDVRQFDLIIRINDWFNFCKNNDIWTFTSCFVLFSCNIVERNNIKKNAIIYSWKSYYYYCSVSQPKYMQKCINNWCSAFLHLLTEEMWTQGRVDYDGIQNINGEHLNNVHGIKW